MVRGYSARLVRLQGGNGNRATTGTMARKICGWPSRENRCCYGARKHDLAGAPDRAELARCTGAKLVSGGGDISGMDVLEDAERVIHHKNAVYSRKGDSYERRLQ